MGVLTSRIIVWSRGITTKSPSTGRDSPPHVNTEPHRSTYQNSAFDTANPLPSISTITFALTVRPLLSVTHSISVSARVSRRQGLPAMVTFAFAVKPLPVMANLVPPSVPPRVTFIFVTLGVKSSR